MKHEPHNNTADRCRESGNMVFFLFLGVVLFAALSFTVSEMLRGGDVTHISEEKANLYSNEILDFARSVRQGVQTVRINGCGEDDISFETTLLTGYAHSPVARESCKIFSPDGGGITYVEPDEKWLSASDHASTSHSIAFQEWYFVSRTCVPQIGDGDTLTCRTDGIDNDELVLFLPWLTLDMCIKLNDKLGVTNPGGVPPDAGIYTLFENADKFKGAYGGTADTNSIPATQLFGKMAGCIGDSSSTSAPGAGYHFYQVLLPR